jgi:hypothetical protein
MTCKCTFVKRKIGKAQDSHGGGASSILSSYDFLLIPASGVCRDSSSILADSSFALLQFQPLTVP